MALTPAAMERMIRGLEAMTSNMMATIEEGPEVDEFVNIHPDDAVDVDPGTANRLVIPVRPGHMFLRRVTVHIRSVGAVVTAGIGLYKIANADQVRQLVPPSAGSLYTSTLDLQLVAQASNRYSSAAGVFSAFKADFGADIELHRRNCYAILLQTVDADLRYMAGVVKGSTNCFYVPTPTITTVGQFQTNLTAINGTIPVPHLILRSAFGARLGGG